MSGECDEKPGVSQLTQENFASTNWVVGVDQVTDVGGLWFPLFRPLKWEHHASIGI
jgi:hypothetical protein